MNKQTIEERAKALKKPENIAALLKRIKQQREHQTL